MMESVWATLVHAMAFANSPDAPLLPTLAAQQMWMHVAWALVLAWVVATLLRRLKAEPWVAWGAAVALAMWLYLPGAYSPSYWLGLAFQAPSLTTAGLCGAALLRMAGQPEQRVTHRRHGLTNTNAAMVALVAMGIVTGWLLLLDTFALLPGMQLYAWGFSSVAPAVLLLVAFLPWLVLGTSGMAFMVAVAIASAVAALFMVLHLPSGNAWDAVFDPWLWLTLHVWAWRLVR
jgi:hypothetical protein